VDSLVVGQNLTVELRYSLRVRGPGGVPVDQFAHVRLLGIGGRIAGRLLHSVS
jgi:hypothetical protein